MAKHRLHYCTEVSAKTGDGIKELVEWVSKSLYHINKDKLSQFKEGNAQGSGGAAAQNGFLRNNAPSN
jgi:hypothetical protein